MTSKQLIVKLDRTSIIFSGIISGFVGLLILAAGIGFAAFLGIIACRLHSIECVQSSQQVALITVTILVASIGYIAIIFYRTLFYCYGYLQKTERYLELKKPFLKIVRIDINDMVEIRVSKPNMALFALALIKPELRVVHLVTKGGSLPSVNMLKILDAQELEDFLIGIDSRVPVRQYD